MELAFLSWSILSHVRNFSWLLLVGESAAASQYVKIWLMSSNLFFSYMVIQPFEDLSFFSLLIEGVWMTPILAYAGLKELCFLVMFYYLPSLHLLELFSWDWAAMVSFYFMVDWAILWYNTLWLDWFYPYYMFYQTLVDELVNVSGPLNVTLTFWWVIPGLCWYGLLNFMEAPLAVAQSLISMWCPSANFAMVQMLWLWFGWDLYWLCVPLPCHGLVGRMLRSFFYWGGTYWGLWEWLSSFQLSLICGSFGFYQIFRGWAKYLLFLYLYVDRAYSVTADYYYPGFFQWFWAFKEFAQFNLWGGVDLSNYGPAWYTFFGSPRLFFYLYGMKWMQFFAYLGCISDVWVVNWWWLSFHAYLWEIFVRFVRAFAVNFHNLAGERWFTALVKVLNMPFSLIEDYWKALFLLPGSPKEWKVYQSYFGKTFTWFKMPYDSDDQKALFSTLDKFLLYPMWWAINYPLNFALDPVFSYLGVPTLGERRNEFWASAPRASALNHDNPMYFVAEGFGAYDEADLLWNQWRSWSSPVTRSKSLVVDGGVPNPMDKMGLRREQFFPDLKWRQSRLFWAYLKFASWCSTYAFPKDLNDHFFYDGNYGKAAHEVGWNWHYSLVAQSFYRELQWVQFDGWNMHPRAFGSYLDWVGVGRSFKVLTQFRLIKYTYGTWDTWQGKQRLQWTWFLESQSPFILMDSWFGKTLTLLYNPFNVLDYSGFGMGTPGPAWTGENVQFAVSVSGSPYFKDSSWAGSPHPGLGMALPEETYSFVSLLWLIGVSYLYIYDLMNLVFFSLIFPVLWFWSWGLYWWFSLAWEDIFLMGLIRCWIYLDWFCWLGSTAAGVSSPTNQIVGLFKTTLGGKDFMFVIESFKSFSTAPLPFWARFAGWHPSFVGTVGWLFLEDNDATKGYRGQYVKSLFKLYPGVLVDTFSRADWEWSVPQFNLPVSDLLVRGAWGLNLLALDPLNQTWTFTLYTYWDLPRIIWFPNLYPHIELFHDWGWNMGVLGCLSWLSCLTLGKYSGYDSVLGSFLPIDWMTITSMGQGVTWVGVSLSWSIRFYGYPWHYFKGASLGCATAMDSTLGGLALTRYPLPWEVGLVGSGLSSWTAGLQLLLLGTRGQLGVWLTFPNMFLDDSYNGSVRRFSMEKGPKLGTFGVLQKDLRLHNWAWLQWLPGKPFPGFFDPDAEGSDALNSLGLPYEGFNPSYWLGHLGLVNKLDDPTWAWTSVDYKVWPEQHFNLATRIPVKANFDLRWNIWNAFNVGGDWMLSPPMVHDDFEGLFDFTKYTFPLEALTQWDSMFKYFNKFTQWVLLPEWTFIWGFPEETLLVWEMYNFTNLEGYVKSLFTGDELGASVNFLYGLNWTQKPELPSKLEGMTSTLGNTKSVVRLGQYFFPTLVEQLLSVMNFTTTPGMWFDAYWNRLTLEWTNNWSPFFETEWVARWEGLDFTADQLQLLPYYWMFSDYTPLKFWSLYSDIEVSNNFLLPALYAVGSNVDAYLRNQNWVMQFWGDFLEESRSDVWSNYNVLTGGDMEDWGVNKFWGVHLVWFCHSLWSKIHVIMLSYVPLMVLVVSALEPWVDLVSIVFIYCMPGSTFSFTCCALVVLSWVIVAPTRLGGWTGSEQLVWGLGFSDYWSPMNDYGWWFSLPTLPTH